MSRTPLEQTTPEAFIGDFFADFSAAIDAAPEDSALAGVVDRYHTPDFVEVNNGIEWGRDRLVAHARAVRKNYTTGRVDVHEAMGKGDGRMAARLTIHASDRTGKVISTEVCMFADFSSDGRLRRSHGISRTLKENEVRAAERSVYARGLSPEASDGASDGGPVVATYRIEGMTCDHCTEQVGEALTSLRGVTDVAFDLQKGTATVSSARALSDAEVRTAVDETGYALASSGQSSA